MNFLFCLLDEAKRRKVAKSDKKRSVANQRGISTQKVEPAPNLESTPIVPPRL